jgi:hypothetical protein
MQDHDYNISMEILKQNEILTLRANFFNLFIAENCLSRERTLGSRA